MERIMRTETVACAFDSTMTPTEFLVLDEHTAALDPKTAEIIMELTDKIVREKRFWINAAKRKE